MKLHLFLPVALLASCAERPLIYTGSHFGVQASGLKSQIPEKVSLGYERSEFAWLPRGGASSVRGSYDTEYRFPSSVAISEKLITGLAANANPANHSDDSHNNNEENRGKDSDLILSTNTRMNLGLEGAPSDGPSFSFNFGFKRAVLALFPKADPVKKEPTVVNNNGITNFMNPEDAALTAAASSESNSSDPHAGELASTYADFSVHARSFGSFNNPLSIAKKRQLTVAGGGARTVQTIATGKAAKLVAAAELEALQESRNKQLTAETTLAPNQSDSIPPTTDQGIQPPTGGTNPVNPIH